MIFLAMVQSSGLAGALIASGGGSGSYSTVRAFSAMIGGDATQNELQTIRARSTAAARDRYIATFDFAVSDAWKRAGADNVSIPDSSQRGLDLARALYNAGIQGGAFNGDAFFNTLFTPRVWSDVRGDIDAKYGPGAAGAFVGNVGAMFSDLTPTLKP